ncbi:hypothetical protein BJX70DRAFT_393452 [Aspergillus crustosus]
MPPLAVSSLLLHLPRAATATANATQPGLEVVCAWPVSGQYGPGTRVLYYVLVAACVFARKEEWLRNACLAGALLFPAIAALHGIVLASVHVDGAIDMDVYGAFQLCSIGILTAPLTVRLSGTYFKDPRRNIIFLWTGLVFAGLLSVTVELFRVKSTACTHDDEGNPLSSNASQFPYDEIACSLRCSTEAGPFSPIRVGSTNEIYVIPSPHELSFGTATLLAAACCVPAIVSLLYFWSLILQEIFDKRFGRGTETDRRDETIEGTNGATVGKMLQINGLVRTVLRTVEAPVLAAGVLAILILGEKNFFSHPVDHGTEPIASIGQWAPIVGAGFAIFGSLYLFLTADDAKPNQEACKCPCHEPTEAVESGRSDGDIPSIPTTREPSPVHIPPTRSETRDIGNRRGINRALMRFATTISIAAHNRLHDYEFQRGPAQDFPEIPAEAQRNVNLNEIRGQYNRKRDSSGNITLSRTGSNISMLSYRDGGRASAASQRLTPRSSRYSTRSRSPSPFRSSTPQISDGDTSVLRSEGVAPASSSEPEPEPPLQPRKRQNTLEVPPHYGSIRRSASISSVSSSTFTIAGSPASPTIVVSADDHTHTPPSSNSNPTGD